MVQLEWPAYSLDWSENEEQPFCTLAVASFVPTKINNIRLYERLSDEPDLRPVGELLPFDFVATRLRFIPNGSLGEHEYLAVSGMGITLWRRDGQSLWSLAAKLVATPGALRRGSVPPSTSGPTNNKNPPAPVTSFDWSRVNNNLIVTGSYDTTCTMWDVQSSSIRTQLIAHDKEVFDVAFSPNSPDQFVSVGGEGSLRMFDTRNLDHSTILYESKDASTLVRVGWNHLDGNFVYCFGLDASTLPIIDVRSPAVPVAVLPGHVGINCAAWAPHSAAHLMIGDEGGLHLWDLKQPAITDSQRGSANQEAQWSLKFPPGRAPVHFVWPTKHPEYLAHVTSDQVCVSPI